MKINLNSESAVPLSQYRKVKRQTKFVEGENQDKKHTRLPAADRARVRKLFEKYGHKGRRIYIDYGQKDMKKPIEPPKAIDEFLKAKGFRLEDYREGIAFDKHDRAVRLGKALKDPSLKRMFDNDPRRQARSKYSIVISNHPYDIAGMSTGRTGWHSCMTLGTGSNQHYVPQEIAAGSLIAYLIGEKDRNVERPVARVLLKPFYSSDNKVFWLPDVVYPRDVPAFEKFRTQVRQWANKYLNKGNIAKQDKTHTTMNRLSYEDGMSDQATFVDLASPKAKELLHVDKYNSREIVSTQPEALGLIEDKEIVDYVLGTAAENGASAEDITNALNMFTDNFWPHAGSSLAIDHIANAQPELINLVYRKAANKRYVLNYLTSELAPTPSALHFFDFSQVEPKHLGRNEKDYNRAVNSTLDIWFDQVYKQEDADVLVEGIMSTGIWDHKVLQDKVNNIGEYRHSAAHLAMLTTLSKRGLAIEPKHLTHAINEAESYDSEHFEGKLVARAELKRSEFFTLYPQPLVMGMLKDTVFENDPYGARGKYKLNTSRFGMGTIADTLVQMKGVFDAMREEGSEELWSMLGSIDNYLMRKTNTSDIKARKASFTKFLLKKKDFLKYGEKIPAESARNSLVEVIRATNYLPLHNTVFTQGKAISKAMYLLINEAFEAGAVGIEFMKDVTIGGTDSLIFTENITNLELGLHFYQDMRLVTPAVYIAIEEFGVDSVIYDFNQTEFSRLLDATATIPAVEKLGAERMNKIIAEISASKKEFLG